MRLYCFSLDLAILSQFNLPFRSQKIYIIVLHLIEWIIFSVFGVTFVWLPNVCFFLRSTVFWWILFQTKAYFLFTVILRSYILPSYQISPTFQSIILFFTVFNNFILLSADSVVLIITDAKDKARAITKKWPVFFLRIDVLGLKIAVFQARRTWLFSFWMTLRVDTEFHSV